MEKEEILNKIKQYVQESCRNDSTGHDWWHIQRVYNNAMLLNQKEQANEFVLTIIVFLHDLYDHKFCTGNATEKLKETLTKWQVYDSLSQEDLQNIINSCVNLGFSSNFSEKKQLSLEGKIAQDADRLDALGAIGIARTFAYGGKKGRLLYDPTNNGIVTEKEYQQNGSKTSISHFQDKLLKIKDLMNTDTAKEIAQKRHEFLEIFLKEFLDEWNGIK